MNIIRFYQRHVHFKNEIQISLKYEFSVDKHEK